jgi:DNA-binding beta-propeller fold protein YncE
MSPAARRTAATRAVVVAMTVAAALLAACQHRPPAVDAAAPGPAWPPAPDRARIRYVQTIRTPEDLGIRRNLFRRFLERLVHGRRVRGMARPYGVAVAPNGTIAVADPDARSVHLFDVEQSRYRRVIEGDDEPLISPVGVVADGQGRFYVSDSVRGVVLRFDPRGRWIDTLGAGGALERPTGLAFDTARDVLWVVDTAGHRLVGYDGDGNEVARFGERGTLPGQFNFPVAVAVDSAGRLFVSDSMNFRVQVLEPDGGFLRAFGGPGNGPGDFDKPKGIALDSDGHVWVVEGLHDVIHVYDGEGNLLTVIGGTGIGSGEFTLPAGIHIDGNRILIADSANHRVQVLRYLDGVTTPGAGS